MLAVMRTFPAVFGVTCLALVASGTSSAAAQIYPWNKTGSDTIYIAVEGEIVKGDLGRLRRIYDGEQKFSGPKLIVDFDSPGGDLNEAMAIGRWIRQTKALTAVQSDASCASACVYAFAGGVSKMPAGAILIHRPFLTTRPIEGADAAMKSALTASRTFFAEMNVPEGLADIMFDIPPEEAKRMKVREIERYRLVGTDIAEDEERILGLIQKLGISRLEYNRRLRAYQQSPELARCLTLRGNADLECAKEASKQHGIHP